MEVNVGERLEILCRIRKADGTVVPGVWFILSYEEVSRLSKLLAPSTEKEDSHKGISTVSNKIPRKRLF